MIQPTATAPLRWFTAQEAATYLRCSRNFLDKDRIAPTHGIPFCRLGRHVRYDKTDLDEFLERTKEGAR
jgi:excisionase family DNA binding protein